MSGESMEPMEQVPLIQLGEAELERLVCGWRRGAGSWFQRRGEAYSKERSVIRKEDDVDGRASVTKDEERVLRGGWTVMSLCRYEGWMQIWRLFWISQCSMMAFLTRGKQFSEFLCQFCSKVLIPKLVRLAEFLCSYSFTMKRLMPIMMKIPGTGQWALTMTSISPPNRLWSTWPWQTGWSEVTRSLLSLFCGYDITSCVELRGQCLSCYSNKTKTHTHKQLFNRPLFGTTRVGRYQKKQSPTHAQPDHQTSFINFIYYDP